MTSEDAIMAARRGMEAAAQIADLYAAELHRMAVDSWLLDPTRHGDYSDEAMVKSLELGEQGWLKGAAAEAARNIAAAIRAAEPPEAAP